jgi:hypothetical protein
MSPCFKRTHFPSLRSMAGIISIGVNVCENDG